MTGCQPQPSPVGLGIGMKRFDMPYDIFGGRWGLKRLTIATQTTRRAFAVVRALDNPKI